MRFAPITPYAGARPIQEYFNPSDDPTAALGGGPPVLAVPLGTIINAHDPYWGAVEAQYVRANGTIRAFGLVVITATFNSGDGRWRYEATEAPSTANLGRPCGISLRAMTAGQYGWIIIGGVTLLNSNASVVAGTTVSNAAAGQGGAAVAGKQILNAVSVNAATLTVAKNVTLFGGSPLARITQNNTIDGWFVGAPISGTGIPASTTITAIDPDARTVTLSANATVGGGIAATVTYNDGTIFYNVVQINRPFLQGAIT